MPKPRTNAEACSYWADGILANEPQPEIRVNSIHVRGDVVYSFGYHFPMGIIVRNRRGRCVRVLLNSDHYGGASGFANTGGDQSSCRTEANHRAREASWDVEVWSIPLTDSGIKEIQCRPREGDPEPPYPRLEVPTYFYRTDPGPEPVKDPHGCIAGTSEWFETPVTRLTREEHLWLPCKVYGDGDGYFTHESQGDEVVAINYGEESYSYQHYNRLGVREPSGVTYKQCPHCKIFDAIHERWSQAYHGPRWGRERGRGYERYVEMMETYGSEAEWREARLRDWRRVREGRKAHAEWRERNFIPFSAVSWTRLDWVSVPNIDREGYPLRKDQEAYYRSQREEVKRRRQVQRAREQREREQRQLERFKAGVRRRRRPNFNAHAAEVARTLAEMREGLEVTVSINDSQE